MEDAVRGRLLQFIPRTQPVLHAHQTVHARRIYGSWQNEWVQSKFCLDCSLHILLSHINYNTYPSIQQCFRTGTSAAHPTSMTLPPPLYKHPQPCVISASWWRSSCGSSWGESPGGWGTWPFCACRGAWSWACVPVSYWSAHRTWGATWVLVGVGGGRCRRWWSVRRWCDTPAPAGSTLKRKNSKLVVRFKHSVSSIAQGKRENTEKWSHPKCTLDSPRRFSLTSNRIFSGQT